MKNIIVGTAGHIDHGKTTLIKALTGRNTDRWEEEQRKIYQQHGCWSCRNGSGTFGCGSG